MIRTVVHKFQIILKNYNNFRVHFRVNFLYYLCEIRIIFMM